MTDEKAGSCGRKRKKKRYDDTDSYHTSKKCRGCPYGFKQYCVGLCWKDVYAGYIGKRRDGDKHGL